ncbi:hypothetical protein [Paenibacillus solani]|uniref:hypothetical protein n=1 Tax=Paenibacillus solani TaxID=1705565 RepID=UPI000AA05FF2|nr:hypothetical protein [Paenibacillus solani]
MSIGDRVQLREAAEHVLSEDSFKMAAIQMKESLRSSGGYHQAVDEIFDFN